MPAKEKSENLGKAEYWHDEIAAGEKALEKFRKQGKKVMDKFLDKIEDSDISSSRQPLNLFHSNVITLRSMLYGQTPKVDVSRRYEDSQDDVSRVASEIMERCLNNDIQFTDDSFTEALRSCLDDYLLPGLGQAKVRYEPVIGPGPDGQEMVISETAPVDYIHWNDFCWSPGARRWGEVRWVSFRTFVSKEEATAKWGEKVAKTLNYKNRTPKDEAVGATFQDDKDTEEQAEVYEIWCKTSKHIYWWSKGVEDLLGKKADPLGLHTFFPCPCPMLANITTMSLVPKAEYTFAQDLYIQIDILNTRVMTLAKAIKVVGVYDKTSTGVQRMLSEATENELIPVDNWAAFAEKGGIKGQIDWMPIEEIAAVMQQLIAVRDQTIQLLYQTTGMSDILRGSTDPRETKGAQELKSKFASVRIQAMQDLFAAFASDLQKIKAEIMVRHFQPQTMLNQSNIMQTPDAQLAEQAIVLLKDPKTMIWRVQIRPESVAMVDYAQLKSERMEYIMGLSQFMQSAAPLAEQDKSVMPTLMEMLKWGLSGFKGSQQIEGVLDKAISDVQQRLQQPPPPPPPDPKVEAMKMKAQLDQQKAQQDMQQSQMQFQQEMQQSQQKFQMEMQQMQQQFQMKLMELKVTMETKNEVARVDAQMNSEQRRAEVMADAARTQVSTEAEVQKHAMSLAAEEQRHAMGIEKEAVSVQAAKDKAKAAPKNGAAK